MKDIEPTRLHNLAKALKQGNKKNAMRICRKQIEALTTPGKKGVWEMWHQQFAKPDNKPIKIIAYGKTITIFPSEYELMTMLLNGMDETQLIELRNGFKDRMIEFEYDYHNARLSYLLLGYVQEAKQVSKQKPAKTKRRSRPDTRRVKTKASTR